MVLLPSLSLRSFLFLLLVRFTSVTDVFDSALNIILIAITVIATDQVSLIVVDPSLVVATNRNSGINGISLIGLSSLLFVSTS